jgi:protein-tyrosine phosphatase
MNQYDIKSILVVCTGNICRSPMAEGVLRYKFDQAGLSHINLNSAGTSGWDNCTPISDAIQACSEIGIDISSLRSAPISEQMIQDADFVLAMEKYHINEMIKKCNAPAEKLLLFGDFHSDNPGMDVQDPYGMSLSFYREILNIICQCSDIFIDKLKKHSLENVNQTPLFSQLLKKLFL